MCEEKQCIYCKKWFPATREYFHADRRLSSGLSGRCKECKKIIGGFSVPQEGYKFCVKCGDELPMTEEYFNKNKNTRDGFYHTCKCCRSKIRKTEKVRRQKVVSEQKRRALKNKAIANYSTEDWEKCLSYFNQQCAYCGCEVNLTKDHVIPVSKGGGFIASNIICACSRCNFSRRNKDVFTWYRQQDSYDLEREKKIREFINCKYGEPMELALF